MTDSDSFDFQRSEILVDRARSGDQQAWRALYERYRPMLIAHAQAKIPGFARRRFDADDVLQTALTKAWQNLESFTYDGEGSFRRWLVTIVLNTLANELKAHKSAVHLISEEALSAIEARQAEEQREVDETRSTTLEAMGDLSIEDRDLLIQKNVEGLSFEAIGQILGCSRERARELYAEASERLQRRLRA
jgi:RNA polymerase sigma-70 factor (ECF subfamily)